MYREELANLVETWTEDNIDIRDNWNDWEEFLSEQGYIKTYQEIYDMDLNYLINEKDYNYWDEENQKWNVESLIENDNDITKMSNGCYFAHNQQYIDDYIIDLFYEQQEEKAKQQRLNWSITQAYIDLDKSINGFSRIDALLFILAHNFGEEKIYFASSIGKVKKELLKCLKDFLSLVFHSNFDTQISLWIPNHDLWSNEEDEHYCDLIRFGGYEILSDGQKILDSDVIILKNEESIHTLEYFTYQNIDDFCEYIAEICESYKNDCYDVGDRTHTKEINEEINKIIDNYWMNTIEFDYAEFYLNQ